MTPFETVCAALRAEMDNTEHLTQVLPRNDDDSVLLVMRGGVDDPEGLRVARIFVDQGDEADLELAESGL